MRPTVNPEARIRRSASPRSRPTPSGLSSSDRRSRIRPEPVARPSPPPNPQSETTAEELPVPGHQFSVGICRSPLSACAGMTMLHCKAARSCSSRQERPKQDKRIEPKRTKEDEKKGPTWWPCPASFSLLSPFFVSFGECGLGCGRRPRWPHSDIRRSVGRQSRGVGFTRRRPRRPTRSAGHSRRRCSRSPGRPRPVPRGAGT